MDRRRTSRRSTLRLSKRRVVSTFNPWSSCRRPPCSFTWSDSRLSHSSTICRRSASFRSSPMRGAHRPRADSPRALL